jgi:hypothetical protein
VTLECPGGGKYEPSAGSSRIESTTFGRPPAPRQAAHQPGPLEAILALQAGATFEKQGFSIRCEIGRTAAKKTAAKGE